MAILKPKKLREMQPKEVEERLRELRLELSKERASSEIGTVKNPGRIREIRRSIARSMFEQHKRKTSIKEKPKAKPAAQAQPAKKPAAVQATKKNETK